MKFYIKLIIFFVLPIQFCMAKELRCNNGGKIDSTDCIQKIINIATQQKQVVTIESGIYLISKPVLIPNNAKIKGINAKLVLKHDGGFWLKNVSNITISNIEFAGGGSFLTQKIINPNKPANIPYIIGFSSSSIGISLQGNTKNIYINNNKFSGLHYAIRSVSDETGYVNNLNIEKNVIHNIGAMGICVINGMNILISSNMINDVLGNMVGGVNPLLSDAKFGDGIYISGVINSKITQNVIDNVVRIGIVLEGTSDKNLDLGLVNDNILIESNIITRVGGSRGSECNAGIWVEPSADEKNPLIFKTNLVIIKSNIIDNKNAKPGAHIQYGMFLGALHSIVDSNQISNFTNINEGRFLNTEKHDVKSSGGIYCVFGYTEILNNKLYNNNVGVLFNPTAYFSAYKLQDNDIKSSRYFVDYPNKAQIDKLIFIH